MNPITFPLKRQMRGPQVADLQDALLFLLERGLLLANNEAARRELLTALRPEREQQTYGDVTTKLVAQLQRERGLVGQLEGPPARWMNPPPTPSMPC